MFSNPNNSGIGSNNQNNSLLNTSLSGFGKQNPNAGNNSLLGGMGGGFGQNTTGMLSSSNNQPGFGGSTTAGGNTGFGIGNQNSNPSSNIFGTFGFSSNASTTNPNTASSILGNAGGSTMGSFGFNSGIGSNTGSLNNTGFGNTASTVGTSLTSNFGAQNATNSLTSGFGLSSNTNNLNSGFGSSNTNSISSGFGANNMKTGISSGFGVSNSMVGSNSMFGAQAASNTANANTVSGFGVSNLNQTGGGFAAGFGSNTNTNVGSSAFKGTGFSVGNSSVGGISNNSSSFGSGFGLTNNNKGGFSSNVSSGFGTSTAGNTGFGATTTSLNQNSGSLLNGFGTSNIGNQINTQINTVNNMCKKPFYLGTSKNLTLNLGQVSNANDDYEFPESPNDTISNLKFSPVKDFVAATSWDGTISVYGVDMDAQRVLPKSRRKIPGCALKCNWDSDGTKLYLACTDNTAKMWDLERDEIINIINHEQPVSAVNFISNSQRNQYLLTGSWDKTIKYNDLRTKQAVKRFNLPCKVFDVDYLYPYAVAITSTKNFFTYKLTGSLFEEFRKIESSIKAQNRCVACFSEKNGKNCIGFATGTITGRVTVNHIQSSNSYYHKSKENFCFRCHPQEPPNISEINLYPVNTVSFHPVYGSMVTGGSDGILYFWDKDNRQKINDLKQSSMPITSTAINRDGTVLVYSVGYDWSRGYEYYDRANMKPAIYVRMCNDFIPKNKR